MAATVEESETMRCAWAPKDRDWCRAAASKWAPLTLDILDEVNGEKFTGLGFHIDVLSEPFLKCALAGYIDDDHEIEMFGECCHSVNFDGPIGAGIVLGKMRRELMMSQGKIKASIIIYGLDKLKATPELLKEWETWSTDQAVAVVISPKPGEPGKYIFGATKDEKPKGTLDRKGAIDLIAGLMAGNLGLVESRLFYKFTAETDPWPFAKRKALSSVLKAVAKALPSVFWDKQGSQFVLPPMGPQTRPEVGNVHVTLARCAPNEEQEIVWGSAMATGITCSEEKIDEEIPVKIEIVTTW
jgi:hypothetical protein